MDEGSPVVDDETHAQLLLCIERYLATGPCSRAASVLRQEIEENQLLPVRYDFRGNPHQQTLAGYERTLPPFSSDSLISLLSRLSLLIDKALPPVYPNLPLRLIPRGTIGLNQTSNSARGHPNVINETARNFISLTSENLDVVRTLRIRELGKKLPVRRLLHKDSMKSLDLHTRIFGHLSSVFCVAFDRTGLYIFTGADDNLVKVWSAVDGLIRFTFRGHNAEISDMTVSHDNSLLATGSVDKSVRVWCLLTGATLAVFHSHTAMVTLISFLPYVEGNNRYLLSAGGDCTVNFYHYDAMTHTFDERPIRFGERTSTGARIVSSCHSPGGNLVVVGDTHRYLHIYRIIPNEGVFKVNDIDAHSDRVDSLDWAHSGLRFASGSRDGLAKIWKFEYCDWSVIVLDTKQRDEKSASCSRNAYKVTMLCWSLEDDFTVTSGSDHILRVWDSLNGNELRQLIGHKEDAFVLTSHPIFRQYVLSAGHDGLLMVWNILEGVLVKKHQNTIENCGNGALFDFAVSPDGTLVAAVDSYGHLSIYGIGTNQRAKTMPKDQFFHTDYMLLVGDASGFFLDEETELAPHLMPPPRLVDADGLPYSSEQQRLVPGRDLLRNDSDEGECLGPAWLNRYMVDPLPQSTLEIMNARCTELREQEMMDIDKETHRQRPVVEMVEDKALSLALVNDAARRRSAGTTRRRIHISAEFVDEESRTDEIASSASVDSSFMSTSTLTDEETTEESESTDEDTSDSDYEENQRRSYRSRRERVVDTDENSASSAPRSIRSEEANARPKRRRRVIIASDEDIDAIIENVIDENEPGPSGLNRGRHNSPPSNRKGSRMQTNGSAADKTSVTSKKLDLPKHKKTEPVILEFPNWMRMVRQLRFPYIAQVGDNVVYFRQGHELYLSVVESLKLYPVYSRNRPLAQLDAEEFCIVDEVRYSRKPFRLTTVKLARLNSNGERTGLVFSVKYHDLENIPDFIILRHIYDASVQRRYQPGDRIESILDNHWWLGTVDKKEAHDEENYPRSHWYSLTVKWDTGEDEKMSPWDVQPRQPRRRAGPASVNDLQEFYGYVALENDWQGAYCGVDLCSRRLLDAVEQLEALEELRPFRSPVDLGEYPEYSLNVDYPIDLDTIVQRVQNGFYRRLASLEQDVRYIAINANMFNEDGSVIVRNSRLLVETLIRFLRDEQYINAVDLYNALKGLPDSEIVEYQRIVRVKKSLHHKPLSVETLDHGPNSSVRNRPRFPSAIPDTGIEWINECQEVLSRLMQEASARYFVSCYNPEAAPAVLEGCDDLDTISVKLQSRKYSTPQAFVAEVERLLQTFRCICDDKRSQAYLDSLVFSGLFSSEMGPIVTKWQRVQQQQNSPEDRSDARRLRNRPSQAAHMYNTRSHPDLSDPAHIFDDQSTSSETRNLRRMRQIAQNGTGFYRSLNNGSAMENDEGSRLRTEHSEAQHHRNASVNIRARRRPYARRAYQSSPLPVSERAPVRRVSILSRVTSSGASDSRSTSHVPDDLPGPSRLNGNQAAEKCFRRRSQRIELREDSQGRNSDSVEEDSGKENNFNNDDSSTLTEQNSTPSYVVEAASSGCRRSNRQRKRKVTVDSEDDSPSYTKKRRVAKSRKKSTKRSESVGSNDSSSRPSQSRDLRSSSSSRSAVTLGSARHSTDGNVENEGSMDGYELRDRSRRSRQRAVNYSELSGDEEYQYTTSVSHRGRIRRVRAAVL